MTKLERRENDDRWWFVPWYTKLWRVFYHLPYLLYAQTYSILWLITHPNGWYVKHEEDGKVWHIPHNPLSMNWNLYEMKLGLYYYTDEVLNSVKEKMNNDKT